MVRCFAKRPIRNRLALHASGENETHLWWVTHRWFGATVVNLFKFNSQAD